MRRKNRAGSRILRVNNHGNKMKFATKVDKKNDVPINCRQPHYPKKNYIFLEISGFSRYFPGLFLKFQDFPGLLANFKVFPGLLPNFQVFQVPYTPCDYLS